MTHEINLSKVVPAPREKVFEAWTSAEWLHRWYGMTDDWTVPEVEVDLRVGGRFRIVMQPPDGEQLIESGEYVEIAPNERLVFTMGSPSWSDVTTVTVDLLEHPDGTEVRLRETGYTDAEVRDQHAQGWPGWLDRLARQF